MYICSSLVLTFLIAAAVLAFFSKDKLSRLAGYFAIKPIVIYLISSINWFYVHAWWNSTTSWILWLIFHFGFELCLLLVIVFGFRDLYSKSHKLPWLFAGFDTIRWGSLLFLITSKMNRYSANLIFFEATTLTTLFAIFALSVAIVQHKRLIVA